MQTAILEFFQSRGTPFFDSLLSITTMLGEKTVFILFITFVLWNSSKKRGFVLFSLLTVSLLSTNFLKALIKAPRPFQVLEGVEGVRIQTATGYSFPSGHTTGAASFYTALTLTYRKRVIAVLSIAAILLVGFSRIYLRVHWPIDVAAALLLGVGITVLLNQIAMKLFDDQEKLQQFLLIIGSAAVLLSLILMTGIGMGNIDEVGYTDLMKLLILSGSGYIGLLLSQKFTPYSTEGSLKKKLIRYLIGIILLIGIQGAKALLPETAEMDMIRYLLTGLWITFLYPLIGLKLNLFSLEQKDNSTPDE